MYRVAVEEINQNTKRVHPVTPTTPTARPNFGSQHHHASPPRHGHFISPDNVAITPSEVNIPFFSHFQGTPQQAMVPTPAGTKPDSPVMNMFSIPFCTSKFYLLSLYKHLPPFNMIF